MYEDNSDDKNKTDSEISFGLAIRLSEVLLEYLLIKNLPNFLLVVEVWPITPPQIIELALIPNSP